MEQKCVYIISLEMGNPFWLDALYQIEQFVYESRDLAENVLKLFNYVYSEKYDLWIYKPNESDTIGYRIKKRVFIAKTENTD